MGDENVVDVLRQIIESEVLDLRLAWMTDQGIEKDADPRALHEYTSVAEIADPNCVVRPRGIDSRALFGLPGLRVRRGLGVLDPCSDGPFTRRIRAGSLSGSVDIAFSCLNGL